MTNAFFRIDNPAQLNSIADVVRVHGGHIPDKPAIIFGRRTTTFGQLNHQASQIANGLLAKGVNPQERIGFLCKNTDHVFSILFGAAKAGVVAVGLNWRLAPPEFAYILKDAGIKILFLTSEFLPAIEAIRDQMRELTTIILDTPDMSARSEFEIWRDAQSLEDPEKDSAPNETVTQLYTSGTTGHPKGVMTSHRNLFAGRIVERKMGDFARYRAGDTVLNPMPCYHVGGLSMGFIALFECATMVLHEIPDPGLIIHDIEAYGVTETFLVPAVIQMILEHDDCAAHKFKTMRNLRYGAAPMPATILAKTIDMFDCPLMQAYGMTEAAGAICFLPPEDHKLEQAERRLKSCGKAMPTIDIKIVDENGTEVPSGTTGELIIRSDTMMSGYWNRPDATAEAIKDGWYYSGDAGYMDEAGYIYLKDRIKDMIISGGENVYPTEVENALLHHEEIQDVSVIGVPDEKWGETVLAVIVSRTGTPLPAEGLKAFAKQHIAGYKIPKRYAFVPELPRNPSGKVLKRVLREQFAANQVDGSTRAI